MFYITGVSYLVCWLVDNESWVGGIETDCACRSDFSCRPSWDGLVKRGIVDKDVSWVIDIGDRIVSSSGLDREFNWFGVSGGSSWIIWDGDTTVGSIL